MTVRDIVVSFQTTYVDMRSKSTRIDFYINQKHVDRESAWYNTQQVKYFNVAMYADGSIRVDICLEG